MMTMIDHTLQQAEKITALQAEVKRLRAAITRFVRAVEASERSVCEDGTASVGALALEENRAYLALEELAAEKAKEESNGPKT